MRTLVVLAVFGVCLASAQFTPEVEAERARFFEAFRAAKQAAASSKYTEPYRGPFAATVPAGVDGRVTPVSDTAEVKAATDEFFRAYKAQVEATKGSAPYSARAAPAESASYVLKTDPATSAKYVLKTDTATSNRYLYKAVPATSPEYRSGSETSVKYLLKTDPATSSKYLYKPDPATAAEYAAMPYSAGSAKYVVKTDPQTSNKYLYKAVPTTSGTYVVKDDPQTAHKYELQAVPQTSATYRAKTDPAYLASHGYSKSLYMSLNSEQRVTQHTKQILTLHMWRRLFLQQHMASNQDGLDHSPPQYLLAFQALPDRFLTLRKCWMPNMLSRRRTRGSWMLCPTK
ncbi:uncharacterized protein [Macrobrachium rosenbergii]|uniref:uncharacterized protein n=1 Tax=Macrobrachium rosenbergii TaxID=79674 RepID=UPI0034D4B6FD